ncbi:MAG: hypothetical protein DME19_18450 [Verrucomicrobia bacterium]|nr:MAG: hypothetical protein DME19_18450 [Verrucomicrobiota bacterium]
MRHLQFRVGGRPRSGRRHVPFPRSDARLQAVVLGGLLVAGFHVKQREVGVNQLFVRPKFLRFVPFGDGGGIVAFAIASHAQGELGIEMRRFFGQDRSELRDCGVIVTRAEVEHRIVVLFLVRRHKSFDNQPYRTIVVAAQARKLRGSVLTGFRMSLPIKIISTDFDGTFFAEFENPPVPGELQRLIGRLQEGGVHWVINTGRDLSSLLETLARAHLCVRPDYLVVVEREQAHEELFARVRADMPRLVSWVNQRFDAAVYEDAYSPFCLIAENHADADLIHNYLNEYCAGVPNLTVVRNDVYARFSHRAYSKGTALSEIARRLGVSRDHVLAAGDHLNDLPMLSREHARWLVAPSNAVELVKAEVRRQEGFVSDQPHGYGVARGLEFFLEPTARFATNLNSET